MIHHPVANVLNFPARSSVPSISATPVHFNHRNVPETAAVDNMAPTAIDIEL